MTGFADNWQNNSNYAFNDLYLDSGGNLAVVSNVDDLVQSVTNSLWLWIGEHDFNTTIGVPYAGIFGIPNVQESLITLNLSNAILLCNNYLTSAQLTAYGINKITSLNYTINRQSRIISVNANILLNNNNTITIDI